MAITLTALIANVRQRADMENSGFVSDDEITHFLNDEIAAVYSEMVNVDDGSLFATVSPTMVAIGDNAFQLPSDFMRLVDVNIYSGSRWIPAEPADPQEYHQLLTDTYTGQYDTRYYLHLNISQDRYELFTFPAQSAGDVGVRYVPVATVLSIGSDTLNWPSNWHLVPVVGAAAKCLIKEESDPTGVLMEKQAEKERVLKDVRAQRISEVKTLRHMSRRSRGRFKLPRLS